MKSTLAMITVALAAANVWAQDLRTADEQPCGASNESKDMPAMAPLPSRSLVSGRTQALDSRQAATAHTARAKSIAAIADLEGDYVLTYTTTHTNGRDGGSGLTIETVEGTDSVLLNNFRMPGAVAKAKIDISQMTIEIPYQIIGADDDYGDYYITYYSSAIDTTATITGTIASDGVITLTSPWGMFFTSADHADVDYNVYAAGSLIEPANATMTYTYVSSGATLTASCPLVVEQPSDTTLTVKNFYDWGSTITLDVHATRRVTVTNQFVFHSSSYNVDAYTYRAVFSPEYSYSLVDYYATIVSDAAADSRTITWGNWTVLGGKYYFVTGIDCTITTDFDISYPKLDQTLLEGDGTQASPYLISSTAQWNALKSYMDDNYETFSGQYLKITADLDFSDDPITPIGTEGEVMFEGDLDGDGHALTGINVTLSGKYQGGVVSAAGYGSCVHDLSVSGSVATDDSYTGGVIGTLLGSASNITSNVDITCTVSGYKYSTGGVLGHCYFGTADSLVYTGTLNSNCMDCGGVVGYTSYSTFTGCVNKGSVNTSERYTGGVMGSNRYVTMTDCHNEGPVTSSASYVSGLCGDGGYYSEYTRCYNTGPVTYTGTTNSAYAAGLFARARNATYTDCWNSGTIVSETENRAGFMAGLVSNAYSENPMIFIRCYNTADITGYYNLGGLVAVSVPGGQFTMTDCYNTGDITITDTLVTSIYPTAGLVAYYPGNSTLTRCYNTGNVYSEGYFIGGLLGHRSSGYSVDCPVTMTGCWNSGDIYAGKGYAGGIAARLYYDTFTLDSCYNTGDVSSQGHFAAGIAGHVSAATLTNCYNAGDITGLDTIAGLVGSAYSGYVNIGKSYTSGRLHALNDTTAQASIVNDGTVTVTDTYYLTAHDPGDAASYGTGLTYAELGALSIDGWLAGDDCTFPHLSTNDYALARAAAVIPSGDDTYDNITAGFSLGLPDGVTWTASSDEVTIDGGQVTFPDTFEGTLIMTATVGAASATTELTCYVGVDGVADTTTDSRRTLVEEKFYTVGGQQVAQPADGQKAIYIVVRAYDDGSREVDKQAR